jgi:two-component system osmolarity sensor histidine kinase EnvZ
VLKRLLPHTLFGRALLMIVTPLVLVELVTAYVFYERHWETVSRRLALGVAGDIAMVIRSLPHYPIADQRIRYLAAVEHNYNLSVEVLAATDLPNDAMSAGLGGRRLYRVLTDALRERLTAPFHIDARSRADSVEILVALDGAMLRVITSRKRITSTTTAVFILWLVGSSLVVIAVAILFLRNQMRPIRRLAEIADAFGKGREAGPIKPAGAIEIRQATTAFVAMRERIGRQLEQRTEMLAGVSHDLRTPLTRMKLQIALLGDPPRMEDLNVEDIEADIAAMERMVEAYLGFARGDGGEVAVVTDLSELLERIVRDARRDGGATIDLVAAGAISVPLKPNAFRRCVQNLIDNARRTARRIAITVSRTTAAIEITIDDDGPGIPPGQREAVFRAFHRLDAARSSNQGGVGLGLTIARDVMRSHGGDITLNDSPLGGLRVRLRLPV